MGKHSATSTLVMGKNRRQQLIIKWVLITILTSLLLGIAAGYIYIKYLENKMHPKGALAAAISKFLSKPAPREPVNFLIIGADWTPNEDRGRSDTLMILRADLNKKKGVLISVPRDFRVEIPGHDMDKINHAYKYGGVSLTIQTVEKYTGLDIHHYVVVNYDGFVKIIDAVGGVTVDVDERMVDWELGEPIEKGRQRMDGITALHYVRFRNDPRGDFSRIERQQKFARALIDESMRILHVFKIPQLINIVANNVETDMTIPEMLSLANTVRVLKQENLETLSLPGTCDSIDGVSYVIPDQDKVDLILSLVRQNKPLDKALFEDVPAYEISVKVLNGCGIEGAAAEIGDILANKGCQLIVAGNADRTDYKNSIIYYKKEDYAKVLKVQKILKEDLPHATLSESNNLDSQNDVVVVVGRDFQQ